MKETHHEPLTLCPRVRCVRDPAVCAVGRNLCSKRKRFVLVSVGFSGAHLPRERQSNRRSSTPILQWMHGGQMHVRRRQDAHDYDNRGREAALHNTQTEMLRVLRSRR